MRLPWTSNDRSNQCRHLSRLKVFDSFMRGLIMRIFIYITMLQKYTTFLNY